MRKTVRYALAGAAAGAANGLFGAGGGMVLVPLLTGWCHLEDRKAFSTSLVIILPLCLVSILVYWQHGACSLSVAWPYLAGGLLGGLAGGAVFRKMPTKLLHRALGLVLVYGGVRMLL
jgi:uncharacterized membrane protein YfcA